MRDDGLANFSGWLDGSWPSIDFSSMPDLDDADRQLCVVDLVHDSVGTLAYSILVFTREFLGTRGSRIVGQLEYAIHHQPTLLLGGEVLDLTRGRRLDFEAISCHAA